jgi:hypothetical protein
MTETTDTSPQARLFLFDRPRVEIPLPPVAPVPCGDKLPVWLSVGLPGPNSANRTTGRFRVDPRVPESDVILEWGTSPGGEPSLSVTVGGCHTWVLEPDDARPGRWRVESEVDACRYWS